MFYTVPIPSFFFLPNIEILNFEKLGLKEVNLGAHSPSSITSPLRLQSPEGFSPATSQPDWKKPTTNHHKSNHRKEFSLTNLNWLF